MYLRESHRVELSSDGLVGWLVGWSTPPLPISEVDFNPGKVFVLRTRLKTELSEKNTKPQEEFREKKQKKKKKE